MSASSCNAAPRAADAVVGIVLAGGKSSRLGRDKAGLRFSGETLLASTVALLRRVVDEVMVIGRDPRPLGIDASWTLDDQPGHGPAGGILTALRVTGKPCLIVSCDLPFMDEKTLRDLLDARAAQPGQALMSTYRQVETGFVEALTAIYEPEAEKVLAEALARGERKLSSIFPEHLRRHLPYRTGDAARARVFFNINFPLDLEQAREMERAS